MAGAGYKLFVSGDVLTAAQVNNYLQEQAVMVFASSAARTTALSGVLAEGMITYLSDINQVEVYNGTTWIPLDGTDMVNLANPVINGGLDYWQKGTSGAVTSSTTTYLADRWAGFRAATGMTVSRQLVNDTTNVPNIQYSARIQRDSGNTSTSSLQIFNIFESVNTLPFIGKTVTLSFYAKAGANYSRAGSGLTAVLKTGTGTDQNPYSGFTGNANPILQTATLTTSWQRFAYSVTLGTSITQIAVGFEFVPVGTAGANDWFEFTGVQLDVGTFTAANAPAFRRSGGTIQGELAACQRYYQRHTAPSAYTIFGSLGAAQSTTTIFFPFAPTVAFRVTPTAVDFSSVILSPDAIASSFTPSAIAVSSTSSATCPILTATVTGATQFRPYYAYSNNSTSAYLGLTAEL